MKTTGKTLAAILSLLVVVVGVSAIYYQQSLQSSSVAEKAVEVNNTLVQAQRTTIDSVSQLDEKLSSAKSKTEAIEFIDNTLILVNFELQKVDALNEIEHSSAFKNSATELLKAYKSLLENEYKTKFIKLLFETNEELTAEEYSSEVELIFHDQNTEIESLNREFLKQQIEFAKIYNLKIQ